MREFARVYLKAVLVLAALFGGIALVMEVPYSRAAVKYGAGVLTAAHQALGAGMYVAVVLGLAALVALPERWGGMRS